MSDDISGRGDPLKSLKLLWEGTEKPKRGPRPKVQLTALVTAAMLAAFMPAWRASRIDPMTSLRHD